MSCWPEQKSQVGGSVTRSANSLLDAEAATRGLGRVVVLSSQLADDPSATVARIASDLDEWRDAVEAGLTPEEQSAQMQADRRQVAKAHDWWIIVDRISGEITTALDSE